MDTKAIISLCLALILYTIYEWLTLPSSSSHIPGPTLARYTSLYRVWLMASGKAPLKYAALHEKYGPIVRTGPNHVSFSSRDMVPIIYDMKNQFLKSQFYHAFRPFYREKPLETMVTTSNPAHNKTLKLPLIKHMTSHPSSFNPQIKATCATFVQSLSSFQAQPVDISQWSFFWSFDLASAIVFGRPIGFLNEKRDVGGLVKAFREIVPWAGILGQVPSVCDWTLASGWFMGFVRRLGRDPTGMILEEVESRIREHDSAAHVCDATFMCKVLAERRGKDREAEHIEVLNLLFEAFFSSSIQTAVTLQNIIYYLVTHPSAYNTLVSDIRLHPWDPTTLSETPDKIIDRENTYLTAVIKETLRLRPSDGAPMERIVPSSGLHAHGTHIPAGTIVSVCQHTVHRDTHVYGAEIEDFRPERWLVDDVEAVKKMDRTLIAFGKGTRACIGREMAMLQLRMVLVSIFREFDIELADETMGSVKVSTYWIVDYENFLVRFRKL